MEAMDFVLSDMRLAALTVGQGTPVLALHGWMDNAASFAPLAPYWQHGRLIALDLPGHGHSGHRSGGYFFVDYLYEIWQVTEQLAEPVHLLGHSMGAMLASCFAGLYPERVRSLQLLDGLLPITERQSQAATTLRHAIASRHQQALRPARIYPDRQTMAKARAAGSDLSLAQVASLVERASEACPGGYRWRADPKLKTTSMVRLSPGQRDSLLAGLSCPVYAYLGRRGFYANDEPERARQLSALKVRQHHWLDGGHHLHMEQPEALVRLVGEVLTLT